jgi:hypothetical protein
MSCKKGENFPSYLLGIEVGEMEDIWYILKSTCPQSELSKY